MDSERAKSCSMLMAGLGILLVGIAAIIWATSQLIASFYVRTLWTIQPDGIHASGVPTDVTLDDLRSASESREETEQYKPPVPGFE